MTPFQPFSLRIKDRITKYDSPVIMGIVNVTPDSFYPGSRTPESGMIEQRVERLITEGADMIDLGAYSSRPGAADITPGEEIERLQTGMEIIRRLAPEIPVSIDTFRASVAETAVTDLGADIINDISGGDLDPEMFSTVASLGVPYILMHMRGTPATMQTLTEYDNVTTDVISALSRKIAELEELGVADIIIDPGFGFAKDVRQNYQLLRDLPAFIDTLRRPVLVGLSRKSMFYRPLNTVAEDVLAATTAANTLALTGGASILRVHDVKEARQAVFVAGQYLNPKTTA